VTKLARTFHILWLPLVCAVLSLPSLTAPAAAQSGTEWDSLYDRIIRLEHRLNGFETGGGGGGYQQPATPTYDADPASSAALSLRIDQVEQELRNLLGQVQELNHQMREVAEQLRRFSEDAEYRFQQLEAAVREGNASPLQDPADRQVAVLQNGLTSFGDTSVLEQYPQEGGAPVPLDPAPGTQVLGTLPMSALEPADPGPLPAVPEAVEAQPLDGSTTASTGNSATGAGGGVAQALYERSYGDMLRRQFATAETGFQQFLRDHASHELAPNAQYWLGETYYARGEFREAAAAFLAGYRTYSSSAKAPDSLLKLGMSLRNLGERDQACATFAEVGERFPDAPATILDLAAREKSRAGC
jgi:tol-pal system protein YbgF